MEIICVTRFVITRQEATHAAAILDTLWIVISARALVKLQERSLHWLIELVCFSQIPMSVVQVLPITASNFAPTFLDLTLVSVDLGIGWIAIDKHVQVRQHIIWVLHSHMACILLWPSDINECAENDHLCEGTCTNTVGSYRCSCSAGYTLSNNGFSCVGM